ncbi:hypothetical protein ENBRE01_1269 [Enteropsectra breve]|nr:hypothetical protein ENBRE01_1269 [Enteropsectra breve]
MQVKGSLIRMPKAVCLTLSLVAATAMSSEGRQPENCFAGSSGLMKMSDEDDEPKTYEFEYAPAEGLVSILKRPRVVEDDSFKQQEEAKETDIVQEEPEKKQKVNFDTSLDDEKNKPKRELTEDEKAVEATRERLTKNLGPAGPKFVLQALNASEAVRTKELNDFNRWLNSINCTPFDIAANDNSQHYLCDYENMRFMAEFLKLDPNFEELISNSHFNFAKQPFLSLFEWIITSDLTSHEFIKEEWTKNHVRAFESYSEMMKFVIEKFSTEDSRFMDAFNYTLEIISRYETESTNKFYGCESNSLNSNKMSENTVSNPQITFQGYPESNSLASQKSTETSNELLIVSMHEIIEGYKDSKFTIQGRRIESSKAEKDEFKLQFQSLRTGEANEETRKRNIRAIAFKSKNSEGKIMLNFITMAALKKFKKEEEDSMLQKLSSCAVFVLYEENKAHGYGSYRN